MKYAFDINILPSLKGVYIVGGSVRDLVLNKIPADYDLVVFKTDPETFAGDMARKTSGNYVCLGKHGLRIHRVIINNIVFDVSSPKGNTIEEDLGGRDFTINAIALCLETDRCLETNRCLEKDRLIDMTGGIKDLKEKKVRMVSDTIFQKDPLRLLRAFRVASDTGFTIEPHTLYRIKKDAHRITMCAPERIHDEWLKLLSGPNSYKYLMEMEKTGLLAAIFPELEALKKCKQNNHHAYNVFDHSLKAYQNLELILNYPYSQIDGELAHQTAKWDNKRKALLKHALLFHDIGKPASRSVHENGRVHFYSHASVGKTMVKALNQRFRFSNPENIYTQTIIKHHTRPLNLFLLSENQKLISRPVLRFFTQAGKWSPDILLHSIADHKGKGLQQPDNFIQFVFSLANQYFKNFKPLASSPKLLTGNDLINLFHLSPSPLFKKWLNQVEELRLAGKIHSKEQACALVEKWIAEKGPDPI